MVQQFPLQRLSIKSLLAVFCLSNVILLRSGFVHHNKHQRLSWSACHGFTVVDVRRGMKVSSIVDDGHTKMSERRHAQSRLPLRNDAITVDSDYFNDNFVLDDNLESLTDKLTALLRTSTSDVEDDEADDIDEQQHRNRLDLFRTRLSKSFQDEHSLRPTLFLNCTRVDVSTIPNAGRGLFATRAIPKGSVITCYPGDALIQVPAEEEEEEEDYDDIDDHDHGDESSSITSTTTDQSDWIVTWGDHVTDKDLIVDDVPSKSVIPDHLVSYIIHAFGDYGVMGLPSLDDSGGDATYLGHFANDGSTNIPWTVEDLAPYIIESSEVSNAVHKDVCGCHMVTVATRDIMEGEEIFVVYGPGYWMDVNGVVDSEDEEDL